MQIEEFFIKSIGEWNSMRSSHSLAFQEFEEIRSTIKIVQFAYISWEVVLTFFNYFKMSLVEKAFVIEDVSRKLFVLRPIGEFQDLMCGTISSPKILLYSSESISQSI